ncbi:MAG: polyphosphate polymerase domain-containing protein [Lachnospiraceae bacterium]|nr:polyphosphate polymerase domain-containing protein [Lachnospiraceae bacterium]
MDYRVEDKYLITREQWAVISVRLKEICRPDEHGVEGSYTVRSVYFDDMTDSCLEENEAGVDPREKFRIRSYDRQDAPVHLELKKRRGGRTKKETLPLSREEAERLLHRDSGVCFARAEGEESFLLKKLGAQMLTRLLQPVILIEYERTAYVYEAGNVRITCDRNIGAGSDVAALWGKPELLTPVLPAGQFVLEVKYDELLPEHIRQAVDIGSLRKTAFSKYCYGRRRDL